MAATKREWYTTGDDMDHSVWGERHRSETFTVGNTGVNENFKITSVKVKACRFGSPETLFLAIKAVDGAHKPTGPDLSTGSVDPSGWALTPGALYEISMSEFICLASTQYALVLRSPDSNGSNLVQWRMNIFSEPSYTGGTAVDSDDGGSSWTIYTDRDFMFEIWGEEPPPPIEELSGVIESSSTTSGALEVLKTLVGEVVSACTFTGILSRIGIEECIGEIVSSSIVTGSLTVFGELKGEIVSHSYVIGRLFAPTVGGFSIYAKNLILAHLVGKTVYPKPACYIGLSTADPLDDASGLAEPTVESYERFETTAATWSAAVAGKLANAVEIKMERAWEPWGMITHWALFDSLTGGNMLVFGKMKVPWTVFLKDHARFWPNYLSLTLD